MTGSLHPDRIRSALVDLKASDQCRCAVKAETAETARAALELVRKCQLVAGLTPDVVNLGAGLLQVFEALKALQPDERLQAKIKANKDYGPFGRK